ncbi:MAG TPA: sugar ABC transporter permease, partial [Geminicoccaceae bacterium]|nr:sugar ABC transporter permease [Geminicoccaceae bacterium]
PVQILLLAFIFVPSLYVFWLSLSESSFGQSPEFVGLANYAAIMADRVFWRAFWNTFLVVNLVVYAELALGLGLALLLAGPMPGKKWIITILIAPYAITEVTVVVMWRYMLEPDVGMINYALTQIGLPQVEWGVSRYQALAVAAVIAIWQHLPFTFLILYAAVISLPEELLEAARVDGATAWQEFRHVILRLVMPALLIALLFRYIFAMRLFSEIWLLTGGGPARLTELLAVYLYRQAFRYHEFGAAAATGWTMLLLSLLVALPYLWTMYRRTLRDA